MSRFGVVLAIMSAACGKVNGVMADASSPDLTILRAGTGGAAVAITSDVGGIDCGATCTATFKPGDTVVLSSTPMGAVRWSGGGCSGTDSCTVTVTASTTITATTCDSTPVTLSTMAILQSYPVPSGCTSLAIDAMGAGGGGTMGGKGAEIVGTVGVTDGEMLNVIVGGAGGGIGGNCAVGMPYGYSGGGGSFVTRSDGTPLVIAGGGGGAGLNNDVPGGPGSADGNGGDVQGVIGGRTGMGGPIGVPDTGGCGFRGSGGAGLLTDGAVSQTGGGTAFANGGAGGIDPPNGTNDCCNQAPGGFGGGGAGGNGGGGGGGYSGGAGGSNGGTPVSYPGGGGGGSFNAGTNPTNTAGTHSGNGQVILKPAL